MADQIECFESEKIVKMIQVEFGISMIGVISLIVLNWEEGRLACGALVVERTVPQPITGSI